MHNKNKQTTTTPRNNKQQESKKKLAKMTEQANNKQWSDMKALLMRKKQDRDKKLGIIADKCQQLVPDVSTALAKNNLTSSLADNNSGEIVEIQTKCSITDEEKSRNLSVGEVLRGEF